MSTHFVFQPIYFESDRGSYLKDHTNRFPKSLKMRYDCIVLWMYGFTSLNIELYNWMLLFVFLCLITIHYHKITSFLIFLQ
jgi:hypothetical protein